MKIDIYIKKQQLALFDSNDQLMKTYLISSAKNGTGQENGSEQTPLGQHIVRAKIGAGCKANTVFVARRPTGEIYQIGQREQYPQRDWILTRILWLSGCEVGFNRLGRVDTMRRYIYIHGTPSEVKLGTIGSRGCIRMHNLDIIELFDLIACYTPVFIHG